MAKSAPRSIGSIVNQLMARRGYAEIESVSELQHCVEAVVGKSISGSIRVGKVKRGILMIYAADSPTMQELTFCKRKLLKKLQTDHPQAKISDVRFRIGQ